MTPAWVQFHHPHPIRHIQHLSPVSQHVGVFEDWRPIWHCFRDALVTLFLIPGAQMCPLSSSCGHLPQIYWYSLLWVGIAGYCFGLVLSNLVIANNAFVKPEVSGSMLCKNTLELLHSWSLTITDGKEWNHPHGSVVNTAFLFLFFVFCPK